MQDANQTTLDAKWHANTGAVRTAEGWRVVLRGVRAVLNSVALWAALAWLVLLIGVRAVHGQTAPAANTAVTTQPAIDAPPAQNAGDLIVRIKPSAVVAGEAISLADVAELPADGELAGHWVLASAPLPGGVRLVSSREVQEALGRQGVNLGRLVLRGASRCEVRRPAARVHIALTPAAAPEARTDSTSASLSEHRSESQVDPSPLPPAVNPATLEGHLLAHLRDRLATLGGVPVLQVSPALAPMLALAEPTYSFEVLDRSDKLLGLLSLEIRIHEPGGAVRSVPALVQVSLRKNVVVTTRAINRGQTLEADMLGTTERTFESLGEMGFADSAALVGQRARRFLAVGDMIQSKDIEPVPLIHRNELVTVWVRRGGIEIKTAAKAMADGGYGAVIRLKSEPSGATFVATVIGPREAEVGVESIEVASNDAQAPAAGEAR